MATLFKPVAGTLMLDALVESARNTPCLEALEIGVRSW